MKRREFITLFGGAAVAWPLVAGAQQSERVRRIGVLINLATDDPEMLVRLAAFWQGLAGLGWTEGRNLRTDIRRYAGGPPNSSLSSISRPPRRSASTSHRRCLPAPTR